VNEEGSSLLQKKKSEIISKNFDLFLSANSIPIFDCFLQSIASNRQKQTCKVEYKNFDGSYLTITLQGSLSEEKDLLQLFVSESSIGIDSYQQQFEDISNVGNIGRWELDLVRNTLHWSKKIYEIFEIDPERFLPSYESFLSKVHPEDREKVNQTYYNSLLEQRKYEIEHRLLLEDGRIKWVRENCESTFDMEGKPIKSVGTCQDITKLKEIEIFLQKSEADYYTLVENTSSLVWSCDRNCNFTYLNPAWENVLGYTREEMLDRSYAEFQPESISLRDGESIKKFNLSGEVTKTGYETTYLTKGGEERYLIFYPTAIFDDRGVVIGSHGTAIDITHKRILDLKLEETYFELGQRQYAIDQHAIVAITNLEGDIIYANRQFCQISKYSREELLGKNHRIINSGFHPPEFFKDLYKTIKQGITWHGEIKNKAKDGSHYWVSTTIAPIKNAKGEIEKYLSIRTDITEIKEADEKIQILLNEKSIILIEVHHRIKNNMNTIYSLLRMEANLQEESSQKTILLDASNRVRSMMLLYDKLYRSENTEAISIKEYFPALISDIINIFPNKDVIKTDIHLESVIVSAKKLSSIGIIINELVTNSMKYSFLDKESGKISFCAKLLNQSLVLSYEDDGIPIDSNINFQSTNSFGLNLISMLIQQLKGTVKIERNLGTKYVMEFKI